MLYIENLPEGFRVSPGLLRVAERLLGAPLGEPIRKEEALRLPSPRTLFVLGGNGGLEALVERGFTLKGFDPLKGSQKGVWEARPSLTPERAQAAARATAEALARQARSEAEAPALRPEWGPPGPGEPLGSWRHPSGVAAPKAATPVVERAKYALEAAIRGIAQGASLRALERLEALAAWEDSPHADPSPLFEKAREALIEGDALKAEDLMREWAEKAQGVSGLKGLLQDCLSILEDWGGLAEGVLTDPTQPEGLRHRLAAAVGIAAAVEWTWGLWHQEANRLGDLVTYGAIGAMDALRGYKPLSPYAPSATSWAWAGARARSGQAGKRWMEDKVEALSFEVPILEEKDQDWDWEPYVDPGQQAWAQDVRDNLVFLLGSEEAEELLRAFEDPNAELPEDLRPRLAQDPELRELWREM